jgi:hypothetical protein
VTAAFAIWIGLRQGRISEEKVRLDLYNRRYDIYNRVVDFQEALVTWDGSSELSKSARFGFIRAFRESSFLFDPKDGVYDILNQMHEKSSKLISIKDGSLKGAPPYVVLKEYQDGILDTLKYFDEKTPALGQKMGLYLNFHKASV